MGVFEKRGKTKRERERGRERERERETERERERAFVITLIIASLRAKGTADRAGNKSQVKSFPWRVAVWLCCQK